MSVAAMVDNEVAKKAKVDPPTARRRDARAARGRVPGGDRREEDGGGDGGRRRKKKGTTGAGDAVSALVSYVPAEAIAAYLVLLPFMDPSDEGYTGRWGLVAGVCVLTVLYAAGYRKLAAVKNEVDFTFPVLPAVIAVASFVAWAFAIPDSPFNDFGFYSPELGGAVGTVVATGISFLGAVTGETLTYAASEDT